MILVCGEALIDILIKPGAINARFGGAPFNVAVGLARLGVPAAFFGGVSSDPAGVALLQSLKEVGVETRFVRVSDAPSMLALAGVAADGSATYSFPVANGADKQLPPAGSIATDKSKINCAVFGSFLAFHNETAPVLLALARALNPGAVICLDPNVRLALLPDPAQWQSGLEAFLPLVDILKISDEDIFNIYGNSADIANFVKQWFAFGVAAVFITHGAKGASVYSRQGADFTVPAPVIAVTDTVGAGDSFLAGLLGHLHNVGRLAKNELHDPAVLRRATEFAVAASAITCQRHGADMPKLEEIAAR
jgi:fructokinase